MALSRITANSIEDGTIVAADIADGSITTAKIADANVTAGKIVSVANTQITGNITSSQIVPDPVFNGNTTVTTLITGAGTVGAPSIAPTGDTNTGIYFPAADNIGFATGGTIRGRWTTDGLCFGSDTAAANALDDYEEGTFTPVYGAVSTDPTGVTYSSQLGRYTKIGNKVFVEIAITLSNKGTGGSGSVRIKDLPFTISSSANFFIAFGAEVDNLGSDKRSITAVTIPNTLTFAINGSSGSTGTATALVLGDIGNSTTIRFGAFFTVA